VSIPSLHDSIPRGMQTRMIPAGPPQKAGTNSPEELATLHRCMLMCIIDDLEESYVERQVIRRVSGRVGDVTMCVESRVVTEAQWNEWAGSQYADAVSYNCIELCRLVLECYAVLVLQDSDDQFTGARVLDPVAVYDFARSGRSDDGRLCRVTYEQLRQLIRTVAAVPLSPGGWMHDIVDTVVEPAQ